MHGNEPSDRLARLVNDGIRLLRSGGSLAAVHDGLHQILAAMGDDLDAATHDRVQALCNGLDVEVGLAVDGGPSADADARIAILRGRIIDVLRSVVPDPTGSRWPDTV